MLISVRCKAHAGRFTPFKGTRKTQKTPPFCIAKRGSCVIFKTQMLFNIIQLGKTYKVVVLILCNLLRSVEQLLSAIGERTGQ